MRPGLGRPARGGEDAEDHDGDVAGLEVIPEPAAERQAVELRNQDLRNDQRRLRGPRSFECRLPIVNELDTEARTGQEVLLKIADLVIALGDQDGPGLSRQSRAPAGERTIRQFEERTGGVAVGTWCPGTCA